MSSPWPSVSASQVARIEIGGTPSRNNPTFWASDPDGHLWVSIADMNAPTIMTTKERITDAGVRGSNVKPVPVGTPLMSFKLTIGRVAVAGHELFTNEAIAAFHVDPAHVSPRWLVHVLPGASARVVTDTAIKGVTLNKAKLRELQLDLPSLEEQRRIAEILDTLDEAIRKTEQVIAKLQQMKRGLLHDLLNLGIDENGELRSVSNENDEKRWIRAPLNELMIPVREPGMVGIPAVAVTLTEGLVPRNNDERRVITSLRPEQHLLVRRGDIAYNMMRMWQGACGLADSDCIVSPAYVVLRMRQNLMPRFAYLLFKSPEMIAAFLVHSRGITSDRYRLYPGDLLRIMARVPSDLDEQERIADVATSFEARIEKEKSDAHKLSKLKQGLMDDLLTGRVRVTVTEESAS